MPLHTPTSGAMPAPHGWPIVGATSTDGWLSTVSQPPSEQHLLHMFQVVVSFVIMPPMRIYLQAIPPLAAKRPFLSIIDFSRSECGGDLSKCYVPEMLLFAL